MLQLVVDGMKLDPANPTLIDGRNSVLAASTASGGSPEEQDDIWRGFATRGLGYSASAVSPSSSSVVEAFDLPNLQLGAVTVIADSPDPGTAPDPGEAITLSIELANPLAAAATGTTASLNGGAPVSYGTVAGGASATGSFTLDIPADTPCGAILTYTLDVNSSLGPVTHTFTLQIGTPTGTMTHVYSSGDLSAPILDLTTVDIPIVVLSTGGVTGPGGPVSYGVMSPLDGPASREFTFVPAGNCGDDITATLQLSDNGADLGTVSFTMKLGATVITDYGPFDNTTAMTIPATGTGTSTGAPASVYPSTIDVSGLPDEIDSLTVTLNGLSHTFPDDLDVLLVDQAASAWC